MDHWAFTVRYLSTQNDRGVRFINLAGDVAIGAATAPEITQACYPHLITYDPNRNNLCKVSPGQDIYRN